MSEMADRLNAARSKGDRSRSALREYMMTQRELGCDVDLLALIEEGFEAAQVELMLFTAEWLTIHHVFRERDTVRKAMHILSGLANASGSFGSEVEALRDEAIALTKEPG